MIAYIFPVVLVIGTFFAASNKGNRIATVKIAAAVFFVLFLCMFIEIVRCGAEVAGAAGAYQYCSVHKIGGGFLGGLLAGIFCPNFGLLGSYVIDVVAMIICLVLITERSALKGVQKGSRKVYETAKESNERHRELAEQRREERELRRMDRKVEGVQSTQEFFRTGRQSLWVRMKSVKLILTNFWSSRTPICRKSRRRSM